MPEPIAAPKPTKKRRRWWRWPLRGLIVLLLAFAIFRFVVHQRVQNRLAAIRDAGHPVTLEELDSWYPYPDGPNAADVYQQAFDVYVRNYNAEGQLSVVGIRATLYSGQNLDPQLVDKITWYLTSNDWAIELLEQASTITDCRYPIEWGDGFYPLRPHFRELRQSARLLKLQSILVANDGDYDRAIDRCIISKRIARSLDQEPLLGSALASMSVNQIVDDQVEYLVGVGVASDEQLQMIAQASFTPEEVDAMINRALAGERCVNRRQFQGVGPYRMPPGKVPRSTKSGVYWRRLFGFEDIDESRWLDSWADLIGEADELTWPPRDKSWNSEPPLSLSMELHWGPEPHNSVYMMIWWHRTQSQVLAVGIAAERYRLRHGALPKQLEDLVPEFIESVPIDPFDGQPLRYRVEDGGAIIYSIGMDETDNGGKPRNHQFPFKNSDITFTFGSLQEKLWPRESDSESVGE